MKINLSLQSRSGKYEAYAVYDGKTVVVKNGHINPSFAVSIRGGKLSKAYRNNQEHVSSSFEIIKECSFKSPSTAAQFVTGRSVDGYNAWKVEGGQRLGDYLKEKNLR